MSGGSYNYGYEHINTLAYEITGSTPLRRAFKDHLNKVAAACKAIEWVDSCDSSPGHEDDPIKECLGSESESLVMQVLIGDAERAKEELVAAIAKAKK